MMMQNPQFLLKVIEPVLTYTHLRTFFYKTAPLPKQPKLCQAITDNINPQQVCMRYFR